MTTNHTSEAAGVRHLLLLLVLFESCPRPDLARRPSEFLDMEVKQNESVCNSMSRVFLTV